MMKHLARFLAYARASWRPLEISIVCLYFFISPETALKQLLDIHARSETENANEEDESSVRRRVVKLFTVPRNRRAALASSIVVLMQQFCGSSIIDSLSLDVFELAGLDLRRSILGLLAFWILIFLFTIPAVYTIDTFGRRSLLLATFPGMCVSMLTIGIAW